ncbi:MAG: PKD domain-containing protein [Bacteroidota bacterium]|nr:PKD domain-containing protein [Bacteroidota bacterium]
MKLIATIGMLIAMYFLQAGSVKGQCLIDSTQTGAGVYPDTLPDATAGQPYTIDVTFVMITDTMGLTINNYQIANVVGLPVGLNWICNNAGNGCNYDPSVSLYGCVNISGTPIVPGNYTMTVTVIADVQLVGAQTIPFDVPLLVLPGVVNNPGFSMVNSSGCDPLTVDFINNNPGQATYAWDFGNGLQSNVENPASQTYTLPGTYVVTQTVTPNVTPSWYLTDITVTAIPINYGGFIDDPDMYFLLYDPSGVEVYDSRPSIDNTFPPVSWGVPNILLQNGTYTVHVWDEDGGLFGGDDDLGTITFAGNGTSGSATGSVGGASGLLVVDYTIFQTPVVPLVATDTVYVYPSPVVPILSASGPITFCEGDSVTFTVSDSVNTVQWYENNLILAGITGTTFTPSVSGTYNVIVTTPDGCTATSLPVTVTIYPTPVKPTFFVNGNTFTTGVTGLNLQWYFNGAPIPGATDSIHIAQISGTYQLCGTDSNGCVNCSDSLVYLGLALQEINGAGFQIFPNPSDGRFTVLFEKAAGSSRILHIYDALGKEVSTIDLLGSMRYSYSDQLPSGFYLIGIEENGIIGYKKLVVR